MSKVFEYNKDRIDYIFELLNDDSNDDRTDDILDMLDGLPSDQINRTKDTGYNILQCAVLRSNDKIVKYLLSNYDNIDINATDYNNMSCLHYAVNNKNINIIKMLMEYPGIDINIHSKFRRWTPLHCISHGSDIEFFKLFIDNVDININSIDSHGCTPLMTSVVFKYDDTPEEYLVEIVKLFLSHPDIDIDITDIYGDTALSYAKDSDYDAITELLENYKKNN